MPNIIHVTLNINRIVRGLIALCAMLSCAASDCAPAMAKEKAGQRAREVSAIQAGEVTVIVNEQFFNALIEAMLSFPTPPKFSLSRARSNGGSGDSPAKREGGNAKCTSEITLMRQMMGARTAVRFESGRISTPVAFRGSYEAALLGCVRFEGWADTNLELSFDRPRQVLTARINVRSVHLSNTPPLLNGVVTELVQSSIDSRINPIEVLRAEQLAARIPVPPGNNLNLRARDVRHIIVQKELRLSIVYEIVRGE